MRRTIAALAATITALCAFLVAVPVAGADTSANGTPCATLAEWKAANDGDTMNHIHIDIFNGVAGWQLDSGSNWQYRGYHHCDDPDAYSSIRYQQNAQGVWHAWAQYGKIGCWNAYQYPSPGACIYVKAAR